MGKDKTRTEGLALPSGRAAREMDGGGLALQAHLSQLRERLMALLLTPLLSPSTQLTHPCVPPARTATNSASFLLAGRGCASLKGSVRNETGFHQPPHFKLNTGSFVFTIVPLC